MLLLQNMKMYFFQVSDRKMINKECTTNMFHEMCVILSVLSIINNAQNAENLGLNNVRIINATSIDSAYSAECVQTLL